MAVVCASAVLATSIASPVKTDAASKNAKAKKAYVKVVKKINRGMEEYTYYDYYYKDFNKDGVVELVACMRGGGSWRVYTYKNGKAVDTGIDETGGIGYLKGKKYIVGHARGSASNMGLNVYKITKKGKAKRVDNYEYDNNKCTHNGKKISRSKFEKFYNKIKWNLGSMHKMK